MTNKIPSTNDGNPFIAILSKQNKILQKRLNFKNISFTTGNQPFNYINIARGAKHIFYFIVCFQFIYSTNARLHRTGQILEEPNMIRDNQRDQTHTSKYQQSVLINCYIKIYLNIGEENNLGLLLLKNETEMKKSLMMYLGSSRIWKITINDIESPEFLVQGGNQSRSKHEEELNKNLYVEKLVDPDSFSLISTNNNIHKKKSINKAKLYYISTTVSFEVPLYKKSKSNEKIIHRQHTLIVSFQEQELHFQNDDVLLNDQFFNRSVNEECNFNASDVNFCENVNQEWRTIIKSRRLLNVPYYNGIRDNDAKESSSAFILPVYLESYLNIETILGIGKNNWRILNGFYLIKREFSLNIFIAMGLSAFVIYVTSIKVKLFVSDHYTYKKDNDILEDVSNNQIINNIEGDQINESMRRVTEAITHSDEPTKTTTTSTTMTIFTIEKKQLRNDSNEIESFQYPISYQELINENTICNNEDMSNNLSSKHDCLESFTLLYKDQFLNQIESNQELQDEGNISNQLSPNLSGLISEIPLTYDPGTSYPNCNRDDIIRNARESLNSSQGTNESQKECENASYVTADSSFTNSPLHEKSYILQPVSKDKDPFSSNHNTGEIIPKKAKDSMTNKTSNPGFNRDNSSKSMLTVIESSHKNNKAVIEKNNCNPHVVKKSSNLSHNANQNKISDEALNGVIDDTVKILPTDSLMKSNNISLTPKTGTNNEILNYLKKGDHRSMKTHYYENPSLNQGSINKSEYTDIILPINLQKKNQATSIGNSSNHGAPPLEFLGTSKKSHVVQQKHRYVIKPLPEIYDNEETKNKKQKSYDVAACSSLEKNPVQDSSIAQGTDKNNNRSFYQNESILALIAKRKEAIINPSPDKRDRVTDCNSLIIDVCGKNSSPLKDVKRKTASAKALKSPKDFIPTNRDDAQLSIPLQDVDEAVLKYSFPRTLTKNMKLTTRTKNSIETGHLIKNSLEVEKIDSGYCQDKYNEENYYKPEVKDIMIQKNVKRKKNLAPDCDDNFHVNFSIDNGIVMSPQNKNDNEKDQEVNVKDDVMDIRALHKQNKARKRKLELEKIDDSVCKRGKRLFTSAELETLNQIDKFLYTCKNKEVKHKYNEEANSFSSESIEAKSKDISVATENTNPVTSRNRIKKTNTDVQCYVDDKGCLKDDSCFRFSKKLIDTDDFKHDT